MLEKDEKNATIILTHKGWLQSELHKQVKQKAAER